MFQANVGNNDITWNDGTRTDASGMWVVSNPRTVANHADYATWDKVAVMVMSDKTSNMQGFFNYPANSDFYLLCEYSM